MALPVKDEESDEEFLEDIIKLYNVDEFEDFKTINTIIIGSTTQPQSSSDDETEEYSEEEEDSNIVTPVGVSHYGQRSIVLPVSFFNVVRNIELLNECRPMSVILKDCKKSPVIANTSFDSKSYICKPIPNSNTLLLKRKTTENDKRLRSNSSQRRIELTKLINPQENIFDNLSNCDQKTNQSIDTPCSSQSKQEFNQYKDTHEIIDTLINNNEENTFHNYKNFKLKVKSEPKKEKTRQSEITMKADIADVNVKKNTGLVGLKIKTFIDDFVKNANDNQKNVSNRSLKCSLKVNPRILSEIKNKSQKTQKPLSINENLAFSINNSETESETETIYGIDKSKNKSRNKIALQRNEQNRITPFVANITKGSFKIDNQEQSGNTNIYNKLFEQTQSNFVNNGVLKNESSQQITSSQNKKILQLNNKNSDESLHCYLSQNESSSYPLDCFHMSKPSSKQQETACRDHQESNVKKALHNALLTSNDKLNSSPNKYKTSDKESDNNIQSNCHFEGKHNLAFNTYFSCCRKPNELNLNKETILQKLKMNILDHKSYEEMKTLQFVDCYPKKKSVETATSHKSKHPIQCPTPRSSQNNVDNYKGPYYPHNNHALSIESKAKLCNGTSFDSKGILISQGNLPVDIKTTKIKLTSQVSPQSNVKKPLPENANIAMLPNGGNISVVNLNSKPDNAKPNDFLQNYVFPYSVPSATLKNTSFVTATHNPNVVGSCQSINTNIEQYQYNFGQNLPINYEPNWQVYNFIPPTYPLLMTNEQRMGYHLIAENDVKTMKKVKIGAVNGTKRQNTNKSDKSTQSKRSRNYTQDNISKNEKVIEDTNYHIIPNLSSQKSVTQISGYSPPILPIPSFDRSLKILENVKWNSSDNIHSPESQNSAPLKNKSHIMDNAEMEKRKISLEEYKKERSTTDNIKEVIQKKNISVNNLNQHSATTKQLDKDLGYVSDLNVNP